MNTNRTFTLVCSGLAIRSILEVKPHWRRKNKQRQPSNKVPMVFPNKLNPNRLTCIPRMYTLISLSPTFSFEPLSTHLWGTMSVDDTSTKYTRKNLN